jgi:hypothetical protein
MGNKLGQRERERERVVGPRRELSGYATYCIEQSEKAEEHFHA